MSLFDDLWHYTATPLQFDDRTYDQAQWTHSKPNGFWVSVGADWERWCRGDDYDVHCLAVRQRVTLFPDASIYVIDNVDALDAFSERYASGDRRWTYDLDWPSFTQTCDGIIIAPYLWGRRLSDRTSWYYTWDCASGCIWNTSAVAAVELDRVTA